MSSFTISPLSVVASSVGNVLNLTGTLTTWTGATTFTPTAGTITVSTNNSTTSQTLTYTAGASQGMVGISDGVTTTYITVAPAGEVAAFSDNFLGTNVTAPYNVNGWIDNASLFGRTSNQLTANPGVASFNNKLLRPFSESQTNSDVWMEFGPNWTVSTAVCGVLSRVSETADTTPGCVGAYCIPNSTNATNGFRIFTLAASTSAFSVLQSSSSVTIPANGWLRLVTTGATATAYIYQLDATTLVATLTTSALTGAFLSAGTFGILAQSGTQHISQFNTYNTLSISASPTSIPENATTAVSITGVGTAFTGSSFTISGVSGCSIASQSASSGTSATVNITTSGTTGTLTITDTVSGASTTVTVAALTPPTLSQTPIEITSNSNPAITFSGAATNGSAPYTYNLYRSANSNLNTTSSATPNPANDPTATIVNTQTTSGTPSNYTDTSPLQPANFYICQIVDNAGQISYTNQVAAMVPVTPATIGWMSCGDSIGAGHLATNFLKYICSVDVTAGGTNYSNSPVITPSSGNATFTATVVSGVIKAIWPNNQESAPNYTSESGITFTITDSTGSGATAAIHSIGGGPALAAKYMLESLYNYNYITLINCSAGGTTGQNWLPLGTNNGTNQANSTAYWLSNAMLAAGSGAAYPIWSFNLGANDSNGNITKAQYKGNYTTIINALITFGVKKIILACPTYTSRNPLGAQTLLLLQQYGAACQELAAQFPGVVYAVGIDNFNVFYANQQLLGPDILHPDDAGYGVLGGQLAGQVAQFTGLAPATGGGGSPFLHPWGQIYTL